MDKAVKHYSSLFKLPLYRTVVLLLTLICIGGSLLSVILFSPNVFGLVYGLFLGFSSLLSTFIFDYFTSAFLLRGNRIYTLRRTSALSLYCWILWFFFIFLGVCLGLVFGVVWWVRLCLLGFSAVLILRLAVIIATVSASIVKLVVSALLQPIACLIPFLIVWERTSYSLFVSAVWFLVPSILVASVSSFAFMFLLDRQGKETVGIPSLHLFQAFLINWITDDNAPFEMFLEKLGEQQDVEISLIKFDTKNSKIVMAIPSIHPGPFKNIGSSLLPSMLKAALEKKFNCVACVPHGLLGHELDLASQQQSEKVINTVIEFAAFETTDEDATPFTTSSNHLATACCQTFGKSALLSFTLAPNTTEDFPQELELYVREEVKKHDLDCCAVVNAHNCIDGTVDMKEGLSALKEVTTTCLRKTSSTKASSFKVGASTTMPKEYRLEDGLGAGGITVIVVKVGKQTTAYVTIDGNNMVPRLREKILSDLHANDIGNGEVFTTDTHSVSAIILGARGYHPIGEVIDHCKLVAYIRETALSALSRLEDAKVACRSIIVPQVKVIGESQLESLCLLIDKTIQRAKKIVVPIFGLSGVFLMLVLMVI
jgi:putative membrane protein